MKILKGSVDADIKWLEHRCTSTWNYNDGSVVPPEKLLNCICQVSTKAVEDKESLRDPIFHDGFIHPRFFLICYD